MKKLTSYLAVCSLATTPTIGYGATMELADITSVDPLGYECIAGEYFEETDGFAAVAFTLSEKVRLPRTCLPEPCDRALSRQELSNLTGTEAVHARFENEWNDYYARYADFCRKETVDPAAGTEDRVATNDFWGPILNEPSVILTSLPPGGGNSPDPVIIVDTSENDNDVIRTSSVFDDDENDDDDGEVLSSDPEDNDDDDPDDDINPVPLPGGLVFLFTALVGLRFARK
ncbi:MAG: hypothetical protein AAF742_02745 [Pseudomonadota bacterium]